MTPERQASAPTLGPLIGTIAIGLLAIGSCAVLARVGERSRVVGSPRAVSSALAPVVTDDADGAYTVCTSSGFRGRVMVHVGKYLHFVVPDAPYPKPVLAAFPWDFAGEVRRHVSDRSLLWALMSAGVVRKVFHVLPPEVFEQKVGAGSGRRGARKLDVNVEGLDRTVMDHVPDVHEPVLLMIDASVFSSPAASALLEQLRASSLRTDLVVVNRATDNGLVAEAERLRAVELADALRRVRP